MLKQRLIIAAIVLLFIFMALLYCAERQAKSLQRDPTVLLNQYYHFKKTRPDIAQKSLQILLNQDNHYFPAVQEYSQWLLNAHHFEQAEPWLEQLKKQMPQNNIYSFQLGYLYYNNGNWQQAKQLFQHLYENTTGQLKIQAQAALDAMASYIPNYKDYAAFISISQVNVTKNLLNAKPLEQNQKLYQQQPVQKKLTPFDSSLNRYYMLKKSAPNSADKVMLELLNQHPYQVDLLKEAGFSAINRKDFTAAIHFFERAYVLTHDSDIAMQLGYLYAQINKPAKACQYFSRAALSNNKIIALNAQNALTNLAGQQTKILQRPYFAELYLSPFSQSRFGLTVVPLVSRLGIEQNNAFQTKEYVFLRRTQDNRSANLGLISQIYEDDVQIAGIGGQISPFKKIPLISFLEIGKAYDLVYQNRDRWRNDVRGGLMYFQDVGQRPAFFDKLKVRPAYYGQWYADTVYFSRYNNNVIGLLKTQQGFHVLQYKNTLWNLYMTGRTIADTHREFYNNLAEIGGGIAFIPSNRLNLQVRFENVRGMYLPAGASVNPYGKYYNNRTIQLLFYVKI